MDIHKHVDLSMWWPDRPVLIGMVHLAPLPGSPGWGGSMDEVLQRAGSDATALAESGFDGVIVENFGDVPFHPEDVPPSTIAAMTRAMSAVSAAVDLPVGINVLRNDANAALSIAAVTGAAFLRVNVHTGSMWTDQGLLTGSAWRTLRLRRELGAHVAILADVHVKHATPPSGALLADAARDAWHRGLADALVVSGGATGTPTDPILVDEIHTAVPEAPILIGSGVTRDTAGALPSGLLGAIVGSDVMNGGRAGTGVDRARAHELVAAARRAAR